MAPFVPSTNHPLSRQLVNAVIARHSPHRAQWHYEHGLILKAVEGVWNVDRDPKLFQFIQTYLDTFVQPDGSIRTYKTDEFNLDQVAPGKNLFFLLDQTGDPKYRTALETLREQLRQQPRTASGGFWHKKIYPHQMWLDGLFMQGSFYAQYLSLYGPAAQWDDLVHQFELVERHARDPQTGLLYHAWDESHQQLWAHPKTGCSPHFWSRAMGWYGMALVDLLEWLPVTHPGFARIVAILGRYADAVVKFQDSETGLWFQVLDQGQREGNYLESSGSAMFVYTLFKAVRLGWLDARYVSTAARGFEGLVKRRLVVDGQGLPSLEGTCSVAGLGGTPYRDGSFQYYISEKVVADDYKGLGPFILATLEQEQLTHG